MLFSIATICGVARCVCGVCVCVCGVCVCVCGVCVCVVCVCVQFIILNLCVSTFFIVGPINQVLSLFDRGKIISTIIRIVAIVVLLFCVVMAFLLVFLVSNNVYMWHCTNCFFFGPFCSGSKLV